MSSRFGQVLEKFAVLSGAIFLLSFLVSCATFDPRNLWVNLPKESITPKQALFDQALRNLGKMSETYDTRTLRILPRDVHDDTGTSVARDAEIPRDITEMIRTALNSIDGRVIIINWDPNFRANRKALGFTGGDKIEPDVYITGGIAEVDPGLLVKGLNKDFDAESSILGQPVGVDYSDAEKSSVASITLDLNLFDFDTHVGVVGTSNTALVHKALKEKELAFTLLGPSFGLKGTAKKIQGRHAAIRSLVQLGVLQMAGRHLKLPYWRLLADAEPDRAVIEALLDDFRQMTPRTKVAEIQKLLVLHGYYIALSGVVDKETRFALQNLGFEGCSEHKCIDEDLFLALYLSVPVEGEVVQEERNGTHGRFSRAVVKTADTGPDAGILTSEVIKTHLLPANEAEAKGSAKASPRSPSKHPADPAIDIQIPFGLNQYAITAEALRYLQSLGKALSDEALRGYIFEIQGHTCNRGRADHNQRLSQRRAEAVRDYLTTHFGFSPDQIKAVGHGMQHPRWSNETEEGRKRNRRVTVVNTLKPFEGEEGRVFVRTQAKYFRNGRLRDILSGMVLTSGDNYFVSFVPTKRCYVYVFQFDSQGSVTQLFPNGHFGKESNPVSAGKVYRVPGNIRDWLFPDGKNRKKEIVLLSYQEPLADLADLHRDLRALKGLAGSAIKKQAASAQGQEGIRKVPTEQSFHWRCHFRTR